MFRTSALDIWHKETKTRPIITLCKKLDQALGNGIATGIITEFCGPPGTGKTQLCFQLCVNVQIPKLIGGVGGRAIFIDTNQNFNPFRLKEIATSCSKRFEDVFKNKTNINSDLEFSVESILSGISYFYCNNHSQLLGTVESLKNLVKLDRNIKLIVIDSFCFLFRSMDTYIVRTRIIYQLLTDLQLLADEYELAIVLTNEITTRFFDAENSYLSAALGDSHGHKIGQRIVLGKKSHSVGQYVASLEKTIHSSESVAFKITEGGIRGID